VFRDHPDAHPPHYSVGSLPSPILDSADLNLHGSFPAEPAFVPTPLDDDVTFRHSSWQSDRRRVYCALRAAFPDSTRLQRFRTCGAHAWVVRSLDDPSNYAIASDHCHDRFCRPCSSFRANVIAANIRTHLADRPYRFLTLTIKTTDLTLKQGIDKLYRSFAHLRRTKLWQRCVTGGCAVCEIKPRTGSREWHPHLHAVIEGKYLPVQPLRRLWLQITRDSFIVNVQRGLGVDKAADYVTKYITKPFAADVVRSPTRLVDAIRALHGRRLVSTFGTWRGVCLTRFDPLGAWERVIPLAVLRLHAARGDDAACRLLRFLTDQRTYRDFPNPRDPPESDL
jgi:hypothetical protein